MCGAPEARDPGRLRRRPAGRKSPRENSSRGRSHQTSRPAGSAKRTGRRQWQGDRTGHSCRRRGRSTATRIAAPIPKEGGDARQAQHGQKAHQAEVEGTLLCQNPQPEGGVALPVRQPPDTVQMKRPKEEEKQRLIPRDFHSAPPNLRSTLPQRRCFCKNWTGKVRKKVENRPEPCYNIPLVRIILYQTLERGVL